MVRYAGVTQRSNNEVFLHIKKEKKKEKRGRKYLSSEGFWFR